MQSLENPIRFNLCSHLRTLSLSTCVLPFIPGLSASLSGFLKRWNVTTCFRKQQTLGHLLYKRSPDSEYFDQQNVVYKVHCSGCHKCYIGQTRRKVRCRLKDHKNAIRLKSENNAIASHSHYIDPFNADIIARDNNYNHLLAKESLLIDSTATINSTTGLANKSLVELLRLSERS